MCVNGRQFDQGLFAAVQMWSAMRAAIVVSSQLSSLVLICFDHMITRCHGAVWMINRGRTTPVSLKK